jgi:GT2 family glycosyltransferase
MTTPAISVCIANWNCREMLRKCLESLLSWPQGAPLEVIVVDNASRDGAADMVEREFPQARIVRNESNRGFARASNQAARLATGQYLFFLNNDTEVPVLTLRRLLHYARAHPEAGMIGPRLRDSLGNFQISYRSKPSVAALLHRTVLLRWTGLLARSYRRYRRSGFDPFHQGPVDLLMGAAVLIPRDVFFECGQWDEDFSFGGEDLELAARIGKRYAVLFTQVAEVKHHGRVSSRLNIGFSTENVAIGYVKFLRKTDTSSTKLFLYKLAITVDSPLQALVKLAQWAARRLANRREKAAKSLLAARGCMHFMFRSLPRFWRS